MPYSHHAWLTWWVSSRPIFNFVLPLPKVIAKSFSNIFPMGGWGWSWKGPKVDVVAGSLQLDIWQLTTVIFTVVAFCDWCWSVIYPFKFFLFLLSFHSFLISGFLQSLLLTFFFFFLVSTVCLLSYALLSRHDSLHPTSSYTIFSGYSCLRLLIDNTVSNCH